MAHKIKSFQQKINIAFSCFFIIFYAAILWFDWVSTSSSPMIVHLVKYSFIIGCALYTYVASRDYWLSIALSLTVLADLFLLFGSSVTMYSVGILIFSLAQLAHSFQLNPHKKTRALLFFWITACVGLMVFALATFSLLAQAGMIGISACYAMLLLYNLVFSFLRLSRKQEKPFRALLFSFIGFLLFLACDTSVMLYNVLGYSANASSSSFVHIIGNCMWTFYGPSQYFLAKSYLKPRK